jgi:hypothetical protein
MTDTAYEVAILRRSAEQKARRHARLLVALGIATEPEPDDQPGDDAERKPPSAPATRPPALRTPMGGSEARSARAR